MKRWIGWAAWAVLPVLAAGQSRDRDWKFEDREALRRTFDVAGGSGPAKLLVDNISGFVHVTGAAGRQVEISVERSTRAESSEALAAAKRDVKLDMDQQGNSVRLYVDGPFRSLGGVRNRGDQYYGYRVNFDYEIRVPEQTELVLKTVNNGEIVVKRTSGPFEIHGLNGGIDLEEVTGYGSVHTLNGKVKVAFSSNPTRDSEFRTLNGTVDVYFQPNLNADLDFHTLNGGVYSDFAVTAKPGVISSPDSGGSGRFVYRSDGRSREGRAGAGGPHLSFHSLNGAIRLHSKGL